MDIERFYFALLPFRGYGLDWVHRNFHKPNSPNYSTTIDPNIDHLNRLAVSNTHNTYPYKH